MVNCRRMNEELEDLEFDELGQPQSETPVALNDENISQEQINEMKMLGIPRPAGVTSERWWRLQNDRSEHYHMIHMSAGGRSNAFIAETLGYDECHVSKVLNTPWVKQAIQAEIKEIYGTDYKKALKDLNALAISVVKETMESGKESEKAAMARWNLEHTVGKASQDIQVTKTTLSEFIVRVDQLRDVTSSQSQLPQIPDEFDTIIAEVIPKGMVIGKRSSGNEG